MSENRDRFEENDSVKQRRAACGYRIQQSCASCRNLVCGWNAEGRVIGTCVAHEFPANLDHGMCDDFKEINRQ